MTASRPGGVTLVAILTWLSGLLQIIPGVVLLFGAPTVPEAVSLAWVSIVVGIIVVVIGVSLLGGSRLARVLVTISLVASIASAVFTAVVNPAYAWSAIATGLVALIGIILLWTGRASDYFNSQK